MSAILRQRLVFGQLVPAGVVDGVVQRRAAAGAQQTYAACQLFGILRVIDHQLGARIVTHQERAVTAFGQHAADELDRGFLLKTEPSADGV